MDQLPTRLIRSGWLVITLLLPVLILGMIAGKAISTSSSMGSLSEAELHRIALTAAQNAGLQGNPNSEVYGFLPLGQWLTKTRQNMPGTRYSRESSLFIYQVKGTISLNMYGYHDPNGSNRYETLVITLFAEDGTLLSTSAYPPGEVPPNLYSVSDSGSPVSIPTYPPYEPGDE